MRNVQQWMDEAWKESKLKHAILKGKKWRVHKYSALCYKNG